MIKHHPKFELIQSYANGDLPASLSIGITIHAEMCHICQQKIAQLTEQIAECSFEIDRDDISDIPVQSTTLESSSYSEQDGKDFFDSFDSIINKITDSTEIDQVVEAVDRVVTFKGKSYTLPSALNKVTLGKSANIGKLSRARLQLNENEIHSNLLHFNPGGGVPEHTHKGFELTVLLDGSFSDHKGDYHKGDFIMLDGTFTHNPMSEQGCLCYTVANDALYFTQGVNKLLNPIGSFIY